MRLKIDSNWIFIPLLLLLIGASVSDNQAVQNTEITSNNLSIMSGNSGGTYYYIAAGQAKLLSEKLEGINVTTQSTSGSPVENMTLVEQNPSNLGIVTIDGFYYAENGEKQRGFQTPMKELRVIQVGHTAYLYRLSLKGMGVEHYSDLCGKKVSVPPVGSTTYYMALAVAKSYGCTEKNSTIIPMSPGEQADALKDGTIDVAFMAGGIPQATVTDLDYSSEVVYLSVDDEKTKELRETYPFWHPVVIDAGTYSGQKEDMTCLSVNTLLACNAKLDAELAYQITKILNEGTQELAKIHSSGAEWSFDMTKLFLDSDILKFHEGAIRYYSELMGGKVE